MMMKIAVVGATGPTGIHLVTELRKTVASVRVIARSMHTLARLFPEAPIEKWPADVLDAEQPYTQSKAATSSTTVRPL
jgi:uncharacterized protein YbjT (DUF2867 family)